MESNEMRSQVAQARDSAVEVMNKSERYTNMVEPELTHLNQKWEEIMQRLKVSGCLINTLPLSSSKRGDILD